MENDFMQKVQQRQNRDYSKLSPANLEHYLSDKYRRMTSGILYKIKDKNGEIVPFKPNVFQIRYLRKKRYRNLILKARQIGFSTVIQLDYLDDALFNENFNVGLIAQDKPTASIIRKDKIEVALDNLPESIKAYWEFDRSNSNEIRFSNGSSIYISNSFRAGTLQRLHISEYGKICNKYPEKAREIKTGALETVSMNQQITIESTAEGSEGHFFDLCDYYSTFSGQLSQLDFKYFFIPRRWHKENSIELTGYAIPKNLVEYFIQLENEYGIKLSMGQKYWYAKKRQVLREDMFREHPSTPKEAFFLAVKGAYYEAEINKLFMDKRIARVSYDPKLLVYTCRDLGGANPNKTGDSTAIRYFQLYGREVRFIDYREGTGFSMIEIINHQILPKPYKYDIHIMPHDVHVHEYTTGVTRYATAQKYGLKMHTITRGPIMERINCTRTLFQNFRFDEQSCLAGINKLKNYKQKRDELKDVPMGTPEHNGASHPADAIGYGSQYLSDYFESMTKEEEFQGTIKSYESILNQ